MVTSLSHLSSEASSDPADIDGCNPATKRLRTDQGLDMKVHVISTVESTLQVCSSHSFIVKQLCT